MPTTVCNYILNADSGGKFVVIVSPDESDSGIVAFSDFSRDFQHRDIVRRWEKAVGATLAGQGRRVAGGGWWKYEGDMLILYGQSADFGRFDPQWLRERLRPGMIHRETSIDVR